MRNSNFNLIKSLGYIVVLVSMASHSVPHEYWKTQKTDFCMVMLVTVKKNINF